VAERFNKSNAVLSRLQKGARRTRQTGLLVHYIFVTIPRVARLLNYWKQEASLCVDPELRKQALASLHHKSFHCHGGAFFAVPYPKTEKVLLELIVAYQTLCDYLDNLCDRANCTNEQAFIQLHACLLDALCPGTPQQDYYQYFPYKNDAGYINKLVKVCQNCIQELPSYTNVYHHAKYLAQLYISLQTYKHMDLQVREQALISWAEPYLDDYPELLWQEFAAASGSTLGIFALLGLAAGSDIDAGKVLSAMECYFPWICGLHILLDYLIDQEEDRNGGDLNFTFYYPEQKFMVRRLRLFIAKSTELAEGADYPAFACTVIEGLLAMYLSDDKVKKQYMEEMARTLVNSGPSGTAFTLRLCKTVRKGRNRF
jgi:tetraprenyl-beta-curcumene synthase